MKDITEFINNELKPRFWSNIPSIFPELNFTLRANRWESPLHYDGTEPTNKAKDKSVIKEGKFGVWDNGKQDSKDIITLFMEFNRISETWEAVNRLCSIVGIPEPEWTPEQKEYYKKKEEQRSILEASADRQKKALFSPDGKETLSYLMGRGWSESEIKEAELGYISVDEAKAINAQYYVGDYYTLSIPLRSGGTIYGFKFRTIKTDGQRDKYVYLQGTTKRGNLFNLTGIQQTDGDIIVVEGELDALHAQVKGIKGVVATSGGMLTEELLSAALQRGIKHITLLLDKDERGEDFVRKSIEIAHKKRISVLVATFPDEQTADGKKVHDIDEYLSVHTTEELKSLIKNSYNSSLYLLSKLVEEAKDFTPENWQREELILRDKVISLANHTPNEVDRDLVISGYCNMVDGVTITKEALTAVADREREEEDILLQKRRTEDAVKRIEALTKEGKITEALSIMGDTAKELPKINNKSKYSKLLARPTEELFSKRIQNRQGDIPTKYELRNPTRPTEKELFTLPSGAITFIVAPTSHGKSTFLQNLALQVSQQNADGETLYFTFEEDADNVTIQLLNKYMNEELCANYNTRYSNSLDAITYYFQNNDDRYIRSEKKSIFYQKKAKFMRELYTSGKLSILYEDYDSTELIEAIRFIYSQTKVKAVFIDYIQLLSKKGNRLQRTEELKEICKDLKDLSIETQLPIIVAAQSNREVTSPLEMHSQKIAEAADLERIANKILFLWNTSFTAQKSKDSSKDLENFQTQRNITLGDGGKIYAKLTKNRGGKVGIEAVLNYNGNTGVIEPNYKPEEPKQQTLQMDEQNTFSPFSPREANEETPF